MPMIFEKINKRISEIPEASEEQANSASRHAEDKAKDLLINLFDNK